jgi:hypothetical protein
MKDRVKRIPIEDLKENNEHSDQQKPSGDAPGAELKPKTNEDLNAENPARQGRRQAEQSAAWSKTSRDFRTFGSTLWLGVSG